MLDVLDANAAWYDVMMVCRFVLFPHGCLFFGMVLMLVDSVL